MRQTKTNLSLRFDVQMNLKSENKNGRRNKKLDISIVTESPTCFPVQPTKTELGRAACSTSLLHQLPFFYNMTNAFYYIFRVHPGKD
jgi:hypothetical protein